jgi:hypothetical protein
MPAPHFEETLEVVVKGDWGFISVVHQRHHIPLYGFKERDFVLLHTFKKLEDGTSMYYFHASFRRSQHHVTLHLMYFVRSVDHPNALVSGQRAHVVIAGFVAKPLDGVILRSSAPFLRNAKTTSLWFISQIDLKGVLCTHVFIAIDDSCYFRLYAALADVPLPPPNIILFVILMAPAGTT